MQLKKPVRIGCAVNPRKKRCSFIKIIDTDMKVLKESIIHICLFVIRQVCLFRKAIHSDYFTVTSIQIEMLSLEDFSSPEFAFAPYSIIFHFFSGFYTKNTRKKKLLRK